MILLKNFAALSGKKYIFYFPVLYPPFFFTNFSLNLSSLAFRSLSLKSQDACGQEGGVFGAGFADGHHCHWHVGRHLDH